MKQFIVTFALAMAMTVSSQAADKVAYFAGGCFWCTEADFEKIDGVGDVISGFMGGNKANPSYEDVAYGRTTHRETVKVPYDDTKVSYQQLLSAFWRMHDPTDGKGSFVDRGRHYSSAIYYTDEAQKRLAEGAIEALDKSGKFERPITTEVTKAQAFIRPKTIIRTITKKRQPNINITASALGATNSSKLLERRQNRLPLATR